MGLGQKREARTIARQVFSTLTYFWFPSGLNDSDRAVSLSHQVIVVLINNLNYSQSRINRYPDPQRW
jgi:hypothetical protein